MLNAHGAQSHFADATALRMAHATDSSAKAVTLREHTASCLVDLTLRMNLADVFTFVFIILGFIIVYIGYWLLAAGLFPGFVERCAETLGRAPIKTTLVGALTFAPLVIVGFVISNKSPNTAGKILGLAIVIFSALAALFGSAGLVLRIGQGLKSTRDAHEPWRRVLRGGIVLALTFVLPFIGTFVVMPLAFISGFGAFLFTLFSRRRAALPATAPEQPEPAAVSVAL
jgi:hypothetical protein